MKINEKRIWTLGSGKGGTGKSMFASGLGIMLSKMGRKVILVDADLGGANLHTCLGIQEPSTTIDDFIHKRIDRIDDAIIDTPFENLRLISGTRDINKITYLYHSQKKRLIRHIEKLPCDDIIIDVGAGTSYNILDFFILSKTGIIVIIPEPTSVENMYRFVKSSFIRLIYQSLNKDERKRYFKYIFNGGFKDTEELLTRCNRIDREIGRKVEDLIETFQPILILNLVRDEDDIQIGRTIKRLIGRHIGVRLRYAGYIPYDHAVSRSLKRFESFLDAYPDSPASIHLKDIAWRMIDETSHHLKPSSPLDRETILQHAVPLG